MIPHESTPPAPIPNEAVRMTTYVGQILKAQQDWIGSLISSNKEDRALALVSLHVRLERALILVEILEKKFEQEQQQKSKEKNVAAAKQQPTGDPPQD